jgi:hypothetical protein
MTSNWKQIQNRHYMFHMCSASPEKPGIKHG